MRCLLGVLAAGAGPVEGGEWRDRVAFTLSWRLRGEGRRLLSGPPPGAAPEDAHRYAFVGSQLRAGVRVTLPHFQLVLEAQDTRLFGVPDDASLPAPFGNLGPGATYFAHTPETNQGALFLKQGRPDLQAQRLRRQRRAASSTATAWRRFPPTPRSRG